MIRSSAYLPFVVAMALIVVASNVLVQFPLQGQLGRIALADILTWGAFTYPFSFLVTDLANRRYGPFVARRIVFVGFMIAVACSIVIPPVLFKYGYIPYETAAGRLVRIAVASGSAFLFAQLLDVTVFNWLRRQAWTFIGSETNFMPSSSRNSSTSPSTNSGSNGAQAARPNAST